MISNIQGASTTTQNKTSAQTNGQENIGIISKLSSDIKLIENLSLIRLTGSDSLTYQGKPAQLLHATNSQNVAFNLINTGKHIDTSTNTPANIRFNNPNQVSLTVPSSVMTSNSMPNDGKAPISQTQSSNTNNLALASKVVNLTVVSSSSQPTTNGQTSHSALVSDGQSNFTVATQAEMKKGDVIRVFVDNKNQLQVLPSQNNTTTNSLSIEALKQSLPKQLSASDMAQLLKQLNSLNNNPQSPLPAKTQQALSQLLQALPNVNTLTQSPDTMKQAIQTSGQFSESLLKNASPLIEADLKMNLSRLSNTQQDPNNPRAIPFPTEQVANAIERISTNQLRHFADNAQASAQIFPMHIDLPIKEGQQNHLIQLDIDQDAASKNLPKEERRWLVKLKFDFEETGRFDARLGIQGKKVGIVFAAEKAETQVAIQQHMKELKQQLKAKDIEVERLDAFQTKLQDDKPVNNTQSALIDVRT